jgi:hypothetical protein
MGSPSFDGLQLRDEATAQLALVVPGVEQLPTRLVSLWARQPAPLAVHFPLPPVLAAPPLLPLGLAGHHDRLLDLDDLAPLVRAPAHAPAVHSAVRLAPPAGGPLAVIRRSPPPPAYLLDHAHCCEAVQVTALEISGAGDPEPLGQLLGRQPPEGL